MILRKPYALLIKYFQKIHLGLVLLCAYIFYKLIILRSFVSDFLKTESYNAYYEPISNYINFFFIVSIIVVIIATIILMILLIYKKKPWKIYMIPIAEYLLMLIFVLYIRNFFNTYNDMSELTAIMAGRDFLTIVYIPQYLVFIIFGIRTLGIDLNKFGFKEDKEYLDIKEEDREEFEVNFEFDKDKITRNLKKFWRNVKYVYYEHKLICNTIIIILFSVTTGYTYYYFGVLHKTYKEGNTFVANNYEIKVNNSYLTDKDSRGNVINKDSKYVYLVLNVNLKNIGSERSINLDRFRIMNRVESFRPIYREYEYFKDLGKKYDTSKKIKSGEEISFILVYKVLKELDSSKYVLYYHDLGNNNLLKKTKLKVNDVRKTTVVESAKINEKLAFPDNKNITITNYKVVDSTTYGSYGCDNVSCGTKDLELKVYDSKILELSFNSNKLTGDSFADFTSIYGKINYETVNGKRKSIDVVNLIDDFYGNYAYYKIPNDININKGIRLIFTFRNEKYVYYLK